jgi:fermentation-respiration switch protein FrsA (DUF1100 family)
MGGILLYAHLAQGAGIHIRSGIAVASSLDYSDTGSDFEKLLPVLPFGQLLPTLHLNLLGRALAPLAGRMDNPMDRFNAQLSNVEGALFRKLVATNFSPAPVPLLMQLSSLFEEGGLRSQCDSLTYLEGLAESKVPVLAVVGDRDRQCSLEAAKRPIDALGEPSTLRLFGKEEMGEDHYGHYDLLIGKRAQQEVLPVMLDWLTQFD